MNMCYKDEDFTIDVDYLNDYFGKTEVMSFIKSLLKKGMYLSLKDIESLKYVESDEL